jgi:hypothetical protein
VHARRADVMSAIPDLLVHAAQIVRKLERTWIDPAEIETVNFVRCDLDYRSHAVAIEFRHAPVQNRPTHAQTVALRAQIHAARGIGLLFGLDANRHWPTVRHDGLAIESVLDGAESGFVRPAEDILQRPRDLRAQFLPPHGTDQQFRGLCGRILRHRLAHAKTDVEYAMFALQPFAGAESRCVTHPAAGKGIEYGMDAPAISRFDRRTQRLQMILKITL